MAENKLSGRQRVLKVLAGEVPDRIPVLCVDQTATYEQMEKLEVYWPEANYRAREMAMLSYGAHSILGFDAVRVPFCQTIEAEALGCAIKDGGTQNLPSPDTHPYKPGDKPEMPADYLVRGRIPELVEAVKILKNMAGDRVLVIGGVIGPYSIAGSLIGVTDLMRNSFRKPHLVTPFLEVGETAGRLLAKELINAGADAICIEDMMASLDMVSPKIYRDLVLPWQRKLISQLGEVPTIIHVCGKLDDVIEDIAETGVSAISVETKVDAPAAVWKLKKFNRFIPLIGGVDAVHTLFLGDPGKVRAEVARAIADGYSIIAPGCSIPPGAPTKGLRAMVEQSASVN